MQRLISGNYLNFLHGFQRLLLFSTSSSSSLSATSTNSFANYLVDSLGFSHQQALSTSPKLYKHNKVNDTKFVSNANSVVGFFKSHGFNDTHLRKMVNLYPTLLCSNVNVNIQPIFMFLQRHGLSGSDLIRVISANPQLLRIPIVSSLSPVLGILRKVMGCDTLVIAVFKKLKARSCRAVIENMMPNVDFLRTYGVPIEFIRRHVVRQAAIFSGNHEKFKDVVIRVEDKLGIPRDAPMFLYGVYLLLTHSDEAIEAKCRIFKSFGWSQSDVDTFMMKSPCCFALSDETIRKKLEFLMNELRLKPANLTSSSAFFTCSLEKRIVPRHKVLLILKEKGLLEKNPSLYKAICMSESCFSEMFVIPCKEVHQVYAKLAGCKMKITDS